jgi:hypothetical protein
LPSRFTEPTKENTQTATGAATAQTKKTQNKPKTTEETRK